MLDYRKTNLVIKRLLYRLCSGSKAAKDPAPEGKIIGIRIRNTAHLASVDVGWMSGALSSLRCITGHY